MMQFRRLMAMIAITLITHSAIAQTKVVGIAKENKPYRILTSGKQVTVKSTKNIESIMVWTATGHRIVEQKQINASSFSFNANVGEKVFFIMIQYEGSKPFTEKIGVQ